MAKQRQQDRTFYDHEFWTLNLRQGKAVGVKWG